MNAFVTGASQGIGRGVAKILSDAGYDIAFTYGAAEEEARSLHAEITAKGRRCFFYQASLEKPDVPGEATRRAIADLDGIDAIVCNAGRTIYNDLLHMDPSVLEYLYGLNYRAYLLCAKEAARDMVDRGVRGNIVFITSTRGIRAYPDDAIYGGLKAALNRSAESMALDLAKHGIRVNCVAPGATVVRGGFTEAELAGSPFAKLIPLGRLGTPEGVGYLVKYIISPEAGYMTGNIIKLDGGLILPGTPERPAD